VSRIVFLRHGETGWNAARRLQGQRDEPLSEVGRGQVLQAASVLATMPFEAVVSSDLRRATETLALLGRGSHRIDPRWREIDVGEWSGRSSLDLRSAVPDQWRAWRAGDYTPPGGESGSDFRERIADALAALAPDAPRVLVVTHGGAIRHAVSLMLGCRAEHLAPVPPASLTIIDRGSWPRLRAYAFSAQPRLEDAPD